MDEVTGTPEEEALARAVHAVYAVEPAEFVATRKEWVTRLRADKLREVARQVAALRKPTVSAAAVNALVRADDPVVARLEDVGARMRHAQSTLDAAALSALRDERDEVLRAWVAAAREHAGGALTAAVEAEVRDTAVAALADPAATEVVTSGTLTRALSYSGFGEVDVADAVARTSTGVMLSRIEGGRGADEGEVAEDEDEEDLAEGGTEEVVADDDAEPDEDDAEDEDAGAEDESTEAAGEPEADLATLEMELDEAEKVVAAARAARRTAVREHEAAQERATSAAEQVAQAQRLLEQARSALEEAEAEQGRTTAALEEAEEELRRSRQQRDTARAALEEAEDG
ncbi:hypothetical protein [Ornithinimicrobium pekingense]|uniref:Transposase n=1 Tax=Ornithinimicrobium pekingense TaxID=384677 RepID=A0ABQ2F8N4_9MICO|nr:hypothetical protein [Ornithinimicrobium pekingense]GGK72114.1 hypothetical protein GCM10011509_20890 [Ornithinimicrobium pekingense]